MLEGQGLDIQALAETGIPFWGLKFPGLVLDLREQKAQKAVYDMGRQCPTFFSVLGDCSSRFRGFQVRG